MEPDAGRDLAKEDVNADADVDVDDFLDAAALGLPPLEYESSAEVPPIETGFRAGVTIGCDVSFLRFTQPDSVLDLGDYVSNGLAALHPGLLRLAELTALDYESLSQAERVDALIALEQHRSWLDGLHQQLLASIAQSAEAAAAETGGAQKRNWIREEVAAALSLAPMTAATKMRNAQHLCTQLPATEHALLTGAITALKALAIIEGSYPLPEDVLPTYENRVLRRAATQTLAQLKQCVSRAQLRLDPAGAHQRHQRAVADRSVRITDAGDGMAWLSALLPAEHAHACAQRLDAAARMTPTTDARTLDQRRADLLIDAVISGLSGDLPTKQGLQPRINVIINLHTLAGVRDDPAWLDGYGPITAAAARQLATDPTSTWRRLITDPIFDQIIDYGTTRYR
ncbi:MAG: hypothetical protein JWN95_3920, partial [Frankiales bacterium]|nr:hypothetical protein [Frankiales bacterium]